MVIKRSWKVVSGSMAAGVVLAPAGAALADGNDAAPILEDSIPVVEHWQFTEKEKALLEQLFEGHQINLDFLSLSISAESTSIPSDSEPSESIPSDSEPSESFESASGESTDSF